MEGLVKQYLDKFPPAQQAMAASLEVVKYTIDFVNSHGCKTLLDAGSGLSSICFHSQLRDVKVRSVDDSDEWAKRTEAEVLELVGDVITVDTIEPLTGRHFDVVFYDYGDIEARIFHFKKALAMAKRYMIIDDLQVSYYREYVQDVCRGKELRFLPETLDKFGRYSALLVI